MNNPLQNLARWIEEAREAEVPAPAAMTLATASSDGQPSARIISLKALGGRCARLHHRAADAQGEGDRG